MDSLVSTNGQTLKEKGNKMTLDEGIQPRPPKRTMRDIRREWEQVKEQVYLFSLGRDTDEAFYQYWRGVRNALIWLLYPGYPTPIRSDHDWELCDEGGTK